MSALSDFDQVLNIIQNNEDIRNINLPKSEEYVVNNRNQRLHVRSFLPDSKNPKAVIIYIHGIGAHINRPTFPFIAKSFTDNDLAFITMDIHGHGYSEGTRVLINSHEHWIEDAMCVLSSLFSTSNATKREHSLKQDNFQCPYFVTGQSLGGCTALACSIEISKWSKIPNTSNSKFSHLVSDSDEELKSLSSRFLGSILLCPAIIVPEPSEFVKTILKWVFVPLMPESPVPSYFTKPIDSQKSWNNDVYIKYASNDIFPQNPHGLGWGGGMRFKTGQSVLNYVSYIKSCLHEVDFPFIVLHDPEDTVVLVQGSLELIARSSTESSLKEIIYMPDGRHDLTSNKLAEFIGVSNKFIASRLNSE